MSEPTSPAPSTPQTTQNILAARQVALSLLDRVLNKKTPLDQALESDQPFRTLPGRDRAFCRMLVSTTLRRLGQIDDLIAKAQDRDAEIRNPTLRNIFRLGVAQILFMAVADHAAVDTSVRLADHYDLHRQKGFINGLLRNITRAGNEWLARQDEGRLNTPDWLLKSWIADYGLAEAAQIAQANIAEAPLDITVKDPASKNYWAATLKANETPTGSLRILPGQMEGGVRDLPGFNDGAWWVQDMAAALPAQLLGHITGQRVLDLCAAPGGKTLQLVASGAQITALDRSANRLKRLSENLERMDLAQNVEVIAADATVWETKERYPFILLDAPCSATGTIRRHPDVLSLKRPQDIERLPEVQTRILDHALTNLLAPGGTLIYCTCSLQKAEGEHQIAQALATHGHVTRAPISAEEIGDLTELLTPEGDLRLLPHHLAATGGLDGFFISRLQAKASF